ncbi:MAG TPA: FGGY-family carbohydrate kinase [bacterium]|nr:FGGY-family carbohydrate kinase [bacterium]
MSASAKTARAKAKTTEPAPELVLAIDLGTSGCKAALVDLFGNVRAWEFSPVETFLPAGGGAEQDPAAWWNALTASCGALMKRREVKPEQVIAVCANTQGEGTLPVDAQGQPLSNAILWMDTRGAPYVQKRLGGRVNVAGFAPHKIARFIRLTGGAPSLTGKDPVGHMLFIKYRWSDIYRRTDKFLNVLDYLNFKLTGRLVSTVDSLMTSWITDNRDPARIAIDAGLCRMIGIPERKIPAPAPCTTVLGNLLPEAAKTLKLLPTTPVIAGSIDTTAAAVGSGAVADGDVHLYLGTSSWLGAHVPYKKTDVLSAIASLPCAVPGRYLMTALQATACGNLNFAVNKLLYPDDALQSGPPPDDVFARLDRLVETAPPGANGLIYTPWIYGERAPIEDQTIRAGLHHLSLEHTRADVVRALYEGIALNTRWILRPVERFLGRKTEAITAVGGGANSNVWCQIFADVLQRPIRQVKNPIEANVRGSAFIAAAALGKIRIADIPRRVEVAATYRPRPQTAKVYDAHFREFTALYHATKKISRRIVTFHRGN